jgi:hypothetical protein
MIVNGLRGYVPETVHDHDAPGLARPGLRAAALPLRHRKELGTKNSVSDIETDVLRAVRLVPCCGNVAGTMRHVVLIACRSGA